MPLSIPTYESQTGVSAQPLSTAESTRSPLADALAIAGDRFTRLAAEQEAERERMREASEKAWVVQTTTQAEFDWQKKLAEMSKAVPTGQATGFADRFNEEYESWMQRQLATAPTDTARLALQGGLLSVRNSLYGGAASWENSTVVAEQEERFEGTIDTLTQLAGTSDDPARVLAQFDQALNLVDEDWMDGPTVEKWRVEGPAAIRTAWLQGLVLRDPKAAAAALGMQPAMPVLPGGSSDMGALIEAQIQIESAGNPSAVSPKGAVGLMQVMPATAREMAIELDMRDVAQMSDAALIDWLKVEDNNRLVGGRYLDKMLKRYGGNRTLALAAYNAGPGAVDEWLARIGDPRSGAVTDAQFAAAIPYAETRAYVGDVLARAGSAAADRGAGGDAGTVQVASLDPAAASVAGPALHPALASLPIETIAAARKQVETALLEDQAQYAAVIDARIEDESAAVLWGKPVATPVTFNEVIEAHGPIEGPAIWDALEQDRQLGRDVSTLAMMPPEDQEALLKQYEPEGEGFAAEAERYVAFRRALDQDAALREDPALYVMAASPDLQKLHQAATAPDAPDGAMATYIETSLRLQESAGIAEPRILSTDQAASTVAALVDPKPVPAGNGQPARSAGEAMADHIEGLETLYGKHWEQVYGELIAAKMPPEYALLATMDDARSRVMMAEAFMTDPVQLRAAVGTDAAKEIDQAVVDGLAEFNATWAYAPNGSQVTATYTAAAQRLAYNFARRMDAADAARTAVEAVATGSRRIVIDDGYLARVPNGVNINDLFYTADQALAALTVDQVADPGGIRPNTLSMASDARRAQALDSVQSIGLWITNEDETGLIRLDGAGNPVTRADGTRVEVVFDTLQKAPVRNVPLRGGGPVR